MSCKKLSEWFVYIVKCSDETFYTGVSTDVEKRVKTHNTGKGAKYTKTRRPVELLWTKKVSSKSEALKLEYKIKQLNRKQKMLFMAPLTDTDL